MKITLLILAATLNLSVAGEHSWITAGGCTPMEFMRRGIVGTDNPALSGHEKLLLDTGEGQLLLEVASIEPTSIKFTWVLITPSKVSSGSEVFEQSDAWASGKYNLFKGISFTCSFDSLKKRVALRLKQGTRYALIYEDSQSEQGGADQPATATELKLEGKENAKPESEVRSR